LTPVADAQGGAALVDALSASQGRAAAQVLTYTQHWSRRHAVRYKTVI
jgi:hypothetical protein